MYSCVNVLLFHLLHITKLCDKVTGRMTFLQVKFNFMYHLMCHTYPFGNCYVSNSILQHTRLLYFMYHLMCHTYPFGNCYVSNSILQHTRLLYTSADHGVSFRQAHIPAINFSQSYIVLKTHEAGAFLHFIDKGST